MLPPPRSEPIATPVRHSMHGDAAEAPRAQEVHVADATLVGAAASGDRDAFAALASTRVDRLFATATLMLRDRSRAEDAVQEALVRARRAATGDTGGT